MKTTNTKHLLMTALFEGGPLWKDGQIVLSTVNSIAREDGSGSSFNVTGISASLRFSNTTVHIRTID